MKVAHFSTSHFGNVIELCNKMSDSCKVLLILPILSSEHNNRGVDEEQIAAISKKVTFFPIDIPRQSNIVSSIITLYFIYKLLKNFNPKIFHVQGFGNAWLPFIFPFLKNTKVVSTVHDPQPHYGDSMSKGDKFSVFIGKSFADHFIVHGSKLKEQVMELFNVNESKVEYVPLNSPQILFKSPKKIETGKKTVLFFGRIWKYKGLQYLIRAEPLVKAKIPDLKIIIAGEGEDFSPYDKMIVNREIYDIRNYRIPEDEVSFLFEKSTIVVLPYVEATQSGIIPIAFQFGRPLVSTRVGSLPDLIDDGKQGILVPPQDVKSLSKAIISILSDEEMLIRMSKNALLKYHTHLSPMCCNYLTLRAYEKAVLQNGKN